MPETRNQKRNRKRSFARSIRAAAALLDIQDSNSDLIVNGKGGKNPYNPNYLEVFTGNHESVRTHLVPRVSASIKNNLKGKMREVLNTVDCRVFSVSKQINSVIENGVFSDTSYSVTSIPVGTNEVNFYARTKSLLRQGNPVREIEDTVIKRETSRTKRVKMDRYDDLDVIPRAFDSKESAIQYLIDNDIF